MAALARKLDFGSSATLMTGTAQGGAGLRLALLSSGDMAGPAKYRMLARRRRLAQIKARHVLDGADERPRHRRIREAG